MPLFHMILPSAVHTAVIGPVRGEPQLVRVVRRDGVDGEIDVVHLAGEQDAAAVGRPARGLSYSAVRTRVERSSSLRMREPPASSPHTRKTIKWSPLPSRRTRITVALLGR